MAASQSLVVVQFIMTVQRKPIQTAPNITTCLNLILKQTSTLEDTRHYVDLNNLPNLHSVAIDLNEQSSSINAHLEMNIK
nr:hypothetical protein [Arsenophonus endosymbiont of Aleurodicus floccissimus]